MEAKKSHKMSYPLFSNGTEFMMWTSRNCEKCVKAVFYDEKRDIYPKYRCAIQRHIEEACIGYGYGNKRDYEATHAYDCPYKRTERKQYKRKGKIDERDLFYRGGQ